VLQKNGHVPSDPALFKSYAEYGHFIDVRIAALEAVVDYTKGTFSSILTLCNTCNIVGKCNTYLINIRLKYCLPEVFV